MGWSFNPVVGFQHLGVPTQVHADGNNAAWTCPGCGHPVLFVYQNGRVGSSAASPTTCPGCGQTYSLLPAYSQPEPPGTPVAPAPVMQII
jgi:predicted RNA-binding Zn-ribbon protein involved in translation (DUF1610 family)